MKSRTEEEKVKQKEAESTGRDGARYLLTYFSPLNEALKNGFKQPIVVNFCNTTTNLIVSWNF